MRGKNWGRNRNTEEKAWRRTTVGMLVLTVMERGRLIAHLQRCTSRWRRKAGVLHREVKAWRERYVRLCCPLIEPGGCPGLAGRCMHWSGHETGCRSVDEYNRNIILPAREKLREQLSRGEMPS